MEKMDQDKPDEAIPCANGCGFFGRAATAGMCSKCYKETSKQDQANEVRIDVKAQPAEEVASPARPAFVSAAAASPVAASSPTKSVDRTRCAECKKKVGLTGVECRCGHVYCGAHRIAEKHSCSFDYKTFGRQNIAKANEKVVAESLDKL